MDQSEHRDDVAGRCKAVLLSTSRRCRNAAVGTTGFCGHHAGYEAAPKPEPDRRYEGLERLWFDELRGPIHGRLQVLRGMCTDERPHVEIDAKLAEVDELVHRLSCAIEFQPIKPTEADLERGRQLAKEHGW